MYLREYLSDIRNTEIPKILKLLIITDNLEIFEILDKIQVPRIFETIDISTVLYNSKYSRY